MAKLVYISGVVKKIYLDYAASTPLHPAVVEAMRLYFGKKFGNAGSLHFFGQEAQAAIDKSRETIAKVIGADFREIIFTGSATEANNLALRGIIKAVRQFSCGTGRLLAPAADAALRSRAVCPAEGGNQAEWHFESFRSRTTEPLRILVSAIEHESVLETAKDLEKEEVEVIYLPVDKAGVVDLKKLEASLNERTILVSVMYVNNEIGTIQPIAEIAEIVRNFRNSKLEALNSKQTRNSPQKADFRQRRKRFGSTPQADKSPQNINYPITQLPNYPLFHTDAVQAFQYFDCDVRRLGVDLMTFSAHKIYGPKGIGALYTRNLKLTTPNSEQIQNSKSKTQNVSNFEFRISAPSLISALITGGGQEFGLRSGTENVPAIVGFAKAVELVNNSRELESKRIAGLRSYFWQELKKIYPKSELNGCQPSAISSEVSPHILNIYFPSHLSQDLLVKLDLAGLAVSSGAACSARSSKPSHVLKALGLPIERIQESLRFSFGKPTSGQEIKTAIKILGHILNSRS